MTNLFLKESKTFIPSSIQQIEPQQKTVDVFVLKDKYKELMDELSNEKKFNKKTKDAAVSLYFYILYLNRIGIYTMSHQLLRDEISVNEKTLARVFDWFIGRELLHEDRSKAVEAWKLYQKNIPYDYIAVNMYVDSMYTTKSSINKYCKKLQFKHARYNKAYSSKILDDSTDTSTPSTTVQPSQYKQPAYVAPYSGLELDISDCKIPYDSRLNDWFKNKDKAPTIKNRIYHAFHRVPREYRKYFNYHGSPLVEAFDVHNCFFVLMCFIFKKYNIPRNEYKLYRDLVVSGKFYEEIVKAEHNAMTAPVDFSLIGLFHYERDQVKEKLQIFRNEYPIEYNKSYYRGKFDVIRNWYEANFPTIKSIMDHYDVNPVTNSKRLQEDIEKIETDVMSHITKELHDLGYDVFQLHDAVYVTQECKTAQFDADADAMLKKYIFNQI